jgi:hypothetical protein
MHKLSGKTDAVHVVIIFGILLQSSSVFLVVAKQRALVGRMFGKPAELNHDTQNNRYEHR